MTLSFERAHRITDHRNVADWLGDLEAFLRLWAKGPEHYLEGKEQLRAGMNGAFSAMQALEMQSRSLVVRDDAIDYEFATVWEVCASGERMLQSGMTDHPLDAEALLVLGREYFDAAENTLRTVTDSPASAALLEA